ncbi:hypothetical protein AB9M62_02095 [Bacillales bacterium AN1005]
MKSIKKELMLYLDIIFMVYMNILDKSHRYFTMLRHPVDRVSSLYYYLMENDYPGYEWMKEMTLEEFVEATPEAQNNQTTLLCGYPINPDVNTAKERLKSFDMVGITELFNESLFLLKKTFNWKNIDYRRVNITKSRLKRRITRRNDKTH